MTIVCATHFTATSSDAVAAHLARRTGERLLLASVSPGALGPRDSAAQAVSGALERERQRLSADGLYVEVAPLHGKVE